jgi:branched-subunit amino acid transport protein
MTNSIWIYILIAFGVSYLLRVLPLTLIRRPITNPFLRSFLYYVPYATLAVMTFPAITETTLSPYAGAAALLVGIFLAWRGKTLPIVASACCITVLLLEFFLV